ncbi:MAG: DNA mismatch repair protein [Coprococcus sp.]
MQKAISILYPGYDGVEYKELSETTYHDLGLDFICRKITENPNEQRLIMKVLSKMTGDARVARFREEVFADILRLPKMRQRMMELLDKVKFLKDFGGFKTDYDKKLSLWEFMHRLDELHDYIECVEAISECLATEDIQSEGMLGLREYVENIYKDACFSELKQDIEGLRTETEDIRSVTIGLNVNQRFEACGIGLISINNKAFRKSNIVSNFADAIASRSGIQDGNEWKENYYYHPLEGDPSEAGKNSGFGNENTPTIFGRTVVSVPEGDANDSVTHYMDKVANQLLSLTVKKLRNVLSKYVKLTITDITNLIPEFAYYIRFAEYIEMLMKNGLKLCKAEIIDGSDTDTLMCAKGIYNLKLASAVLEKHEEIITNDLIFDNAHLAYILTGANRGGKTTITQAVGLLYVLAQGGIYVPGNQFAFVPVDCIYTHFPADEDKTMDLGRLGEECSRFKNIYSACTKDSLLLLNETFSTTSFEEGYFIARDSVRAILAKGVRMIYNTHMHKLAYDIDEMNQGNRPYKAASLIVKADDGKRSFKVEVAKPEGISYAKDIAEKYGVTYEMLVGNEG